MVICRPGEPLLYCSCASRIDAKCRTSALTGLVKPGERYRVFNPSDVKIRLVRMAAEEPRLPEVRIISVDGRKQLAGHRQMTHADTQGVMEHFP